RGNCVAKSHSPLRRRRAIGAASPMGLPRDNSEKVSCGTRLGKIIRSNWRMDMAIEKSEETAQAKRLLDRVAIVTGSGQGMGRGIARCLARAGAHVVIADQAAERIAPAVAEVEAQGVSSLGIATDVSRAEDVKRMVQQTLDRFGKIDILVNNAGRVV